MRVVVAGSSGFVGTALRASLAADGHEVVRLIRRPASAAGEVTWDPAAGPLDADVLSGADAVINLAGAGVGDHRWTAAYKQTLRTSRTQPTTSLALALATAASRGEGPQVLLNASAIGFYGSRGDEVLTEGSPRGDTFLADVCRAWEAATRPAEEAGIRVCHLRSGLVFGSGGGLLGRLVPLFRAGVGGRLGRGQQWMSWISLTDEVAAIRFLLDRDVRGAVNLTSAAPVRNAEFTRVLARILHRPALFPVPAAALKAVLGEFSSEALTSLNVRPDALVTAGFAFRHPDLSGALSSATGATGQATSV